MRRVFLQALIVTVVIVVAADLLAQRMASNSVPRQVMRTISNAPEAIDVLAIGNSLIAAGFDPAAVEQTFREARRSCVAVNGGLGASGVIEHLALTRLAFRHHTVKSVIYGFFDQQMSSPLAEKNSELIGNHNMLYYQEPQLTLQYANFDLLDRLSFMVYRSSALLRERSAIWAKVDGAQWVLLECPQRRATSLDARLISLFSRLAIREASYSSAKKQSNPPSFCLPPFEPCSNTLASMVQT